MLLSRLGQEGASESTVSPDVGNRKCSQGSATQHHAAAMRYRVPGIVARPGTAADPPGPSGLNTVSQLGASAHGSHMRRCSALYRGTRRRSVGLLASHRVLGHRWTWSVHARGAAPPCELGSWRNHHQREVVSRFPLNLSYWASTISPGQAATNIRWSIRGSTICLSARSPTPYRARASGIGLVDGR